MQGCTLSSALKWYLQTWIASAVGVYLQANRPQPPYVLVQCCYDPTSDMRIKLYSPSSLAIDIASALKPVFSY
jgi:hypothetical protein